MSLIGKDIVLSVSEPFDYESPDGANLVEARIVEFSTKKGVLSLVAEAKFEVHIPRNKVSGQRLIMQTRYGGDRLGDVAKGQRVVVGCAIVPTGKSDYAAVYAIIGDVRLKDGK